MPTGVESAAEHHLVLLLNSPVALAEAQDRLLQPRYELPSAVFPNGIPEELRVLEPWVPSWPETVLPNPEISRIEFKLLQTLVERPNLDMVHCGLTPSILQEATRFNPNTGCWERYVSKDYGRVNDVHLGVSGAQAHRVFWQELVGNTLGYTLSPTDVLDHRCLNKSCCYPRHIDLTNTAGNNRTARQDKARRGQLPLLVVVHQPEPQLHPGELSHPID